MVNRNIQLRVSTHTSDGRALKPHHDAENRLKIGEYEARSGAKLPTCWKMHRRALHVILMERKGFRTSHRGSVALQRVAGPLDSVWTVYHSGLTKSYEFTVLIKVQSVTGDVKKHRSLRVQD